MTPPADGAVDGKGVLPDDAEPVRSAAPSSTVHDVRPARVDDVPALAATLSRAFVTDPVSEFLIPSDRRRPAGLERFFAVQMSLDLVRFGGVYTNEDRTGGALWAPPGKPPVPPWPMVRMLAAMFPYVAGPHLARTIRFIAEVEAIHPTEPHWYLATLGTEPSLQGRGIGSALLGPVLRRCDAGGRPAYLESSKEQNVPFYRRHGFEVTREVRLAGGPPLWLMWREPNPPEA
jgi:GNAT superfamily N-acetyltransferase